MTKLDELFRFSQNALNVHAYRQQLIASNIANADTPGYRARDIDFAAVLKNVESAQAKLQPPVKRSGPDATPSPTAMPRPNWLSLHQTTSRTWTTRSSRSMRAAGRSGWP